MLFHYRLSPESESAWNAIGSDYVVRDASCCDRCGGLLNWRKTDLVTLAEDGSYRVVFFPTCSVCGDTPMEGRPASN